MTCADGHPPPRALATGAAWRLLDEPVLRQGAQVERHVRRRLTEQLPGFGRGERPLPAEGLEERHPQRVGDGADLAGVGQLPAGHTRPWAASPRRFGDVGSPAEVTKTRSAPVRRQGRPPAPARTGRSAGPAGFRDAPALDRRRRAGSSPLATGRRGRSRAWRPGRRALSGEHHQLRVHCGPPLITRFISKHILRKESLSTCFAYDALVAALPLIDISPLLDPGADHRRDRSADRRRMPPLRVLPHHRARGPRRTAGGARAARPGVLRPARRRQSRDRDGPRRRGVAGLVPARRRAHVRPAGPQGRDLLRHRARPRPPGRAGRAAAARSEPVPRHSRRARPGRAGVDRRDDRRSGPCCCAPSPSVWPCRRTGSSAT